MNDRIDNLLPKSKVQNTNHNIKSVNIYKDAEQMRVLPRQVGTGNTRGQQQIYGSQFVRDENNTVRLVMGYSKGAF